MELLEIEKELAGAEKMMALAKYDGILLELGERLKVALARGLPPEEFGRCAELADVVTVARKLLRLQLKS